MFQHYIKTIWRHIARSKVNFGFKVGGLSLALCSLLIIVLYVSYQWSFDTFHTDHENVYRVNSNRDEDGNMVAYSMVPPAIGPALKEAFPEVVASARFGIPGRVMVQYRDKLFRMTGFAEADSSIFDVLTFTFLRGDKRALDQPGSVVLTQSVARQIFGEEDPVGKVITSPDHGNRPLHVSAIIADFPANSHLSINALHSFGALMGTDVNSWEITWDGSMNVYVRLSPQADAHAIGSKAEPLLRKNIVKNEEGSEKRFGISLQPVAKIYLDKTLKMEFSKKGNAFYVYLFSLLGVFLLAIASINYVNLSIADFDTRSREIGVRKVLGARKRQIALQVGLEAAMISVVSLIAGATLLYLIFPLVSAMLEANLRFEMLWSNQVMFMMALIIVLFILFSAAYPAYRLTDHAPADELKPGSSYGSGMRVGKVLLMVQYVISIVCICATLIVGRQLSFVQEKDLGYDRSRVVSLVMPDEYPAERVAVLKTEMGRLAGVEAVSYSYYLMPISTYFRDWYQVEKNGRLEKMLLNEMFVDHDYFETMGIGLVAGRNFSKASAADAEEAFIINESAARAFGWEEAVGKRMKYGYSDTDNKVGEGTVIGVVKDFNTLSLHKKIEPVVLRLPPDSWPGNALNVRVQGPMSEILPVITSTYERLMPGYLADARVLEDLHQRQYREEDKALASLRVATVIIILISVLGIISLSLYMSVRRMKEFGIRKVLGATMGQIASLHAGYFLKVALLANIIALPLAWWLMQRWLDDFAYRTSLNGGIFIAVMLASLVLVLFSGSYAALQAARANPVDVIRN